MKDVQRWLLGLSCLVLLACATPLRAAPDDLDPVPALREARLRMDAGKIEKALEAVESLRTGRLADHVEFLRAGWLRGLERNSEALVALRAALEHSPPSDLRATIHQEKASLHLSLDDLVSAFASTEHAWESTKDKELAAELVVSLAKEFESRGLPGDALNLYRQAWQRWPLSDASEGAYLRSLFLMEATSAPAAPVESHLKRADRLRDSFRCSSALPIYDASLAREDFPKSQRPRSERGRADCLFKLRRYAEAAIAYGLVSKRDPDNLDPAIRVARSHARAGDTDRALARFDQLSRKASPNELARIRYLMGVLLRTRDAKRADKLFRAVERQKASPGLSRLAGWRLAWSQLLGGDHKGAAKRLKPFTKGSSSDVEVQRARYWTAVAQLEYDRPKGEAGLRKMLKDVPLSYYGLLCAERLGAEPVLDRKLVREARRDETYPRAQRARWLIDGGFPIQAGYELDSWRREHRLSRTERLAAAPLLHAIGNHFRAVRLLIDGFGGALEQGIDPDWRDAWTHAWPQVFGVSVNDAVKEFEMDAALVYAVMREESTYRPAVSSPVGARGLMQIIPPTGLRIAQSLGVDPYDPDQLFDAPTNVRFGTYYLNKLLGQFDGRRPHAIAAYNAGPEAVNGWLSRDGTRPTDVFVDSVPYGETRRYLRRVLRSYHMYRRLYGEAPPAAVAAPAKTHLF